MTGESLWRNLWARAVRNRLSACFGALGGLDGPDVFPGERMVRDSSGDQPYTGRLFRADITPRRYADAYLDDLALRQPPLSGKTISNYRWGLKWLTDVHPTVLPRNAEAVIELSSFSKTWPHAHDRRCTICSGTSTPGRGSGTWARTANFLPCPTFHSAGVNGVRNGEADGHGRINAERLCEEAFSEKSV